MTIDTSTIDLAKLNEIAPASTYKAAQPESPRNMGSCCFGDPPGYPSYFTLSVYTRAGNSPSRGTTLELFGREIESAEKYDENARARIFQAIYRPLPFTHPRVQLWVRSTMQHLKGCYIDDNKEGRDKMVIVPAPYYELPSLRAFCDDPRFSDEWREREKAAIEAANVTIQAERDAIKNARAKLGTIDNHAGVRAIRRWYPDFARVDWLTPEVLESGFEPLFQADWWERFAECPSESECIGHLGTPHGALDNCRLCGRVGLREAVSA